MPVSCDPSSVLPNGFDANLALILVDREDYADWRVVHNSSAGVAGLATVVRVSPQGYINPIRSIPDCMAHSRRQPQLCEVALSRRIPDDVVRHSFERSLRMSFNGRPP